jgi:uncharacterized membrane protein (DUF485 family)
MTSTASSRRARLGLRLFAAYTLLYAGFVGGNAFFPDRMEAAPLAGVNWAVLSGLGLIVTAFALALAYGWMCRDDRGGPRPGERP